MGTLVAALALVDKDRRLLLLLVLPLRLGDDGSIVFVLLCRLLLFLFLLFATVVLLVSLLTIPDNNQSRNSSFSVMVGGCDEEADEKDARRSAKMRCNSSGGLSNFTANF